MVFEGLKAFLFISKFLHKDRAMKKIILAVLTAFLFLSTAFTADYKRIVSLAPSITRSLYELGLDAEIVGISMHCPKGKYPKTIIGTLLEPDIERIIALKPDLIIATKEGNSRELLLKLMKLKFNTYVMETNSDFEEMCSNFYLLAQKLNRQDIGRKIVEQAKAAVEKSYSLRKDKNIQTMFWEVGTNPLYTAGKQSFLNDYNRYTRTKNIYENVINARYSPVIIEDVLSRNPDIIVIVDMDANDASVESWNKYANIKAVKNKRVYMLKADDLFSPTPTNFADTVKQLNKIIRD